MNRPTICRLGVPVDELVPYLTDRGFKQVSLRQLDDISREYLRKLDRVTEMTLSIRALHERSWGWAGDAIERARG